MRRLKPPFSCGVVPTRTPLSTSSAKLGAIVNSSTPFVCFRVDWTAGCRTRTDREQKIFSLLTSIVGCTRCSICLLPLSYMGIQMHGVQVPTRLCGRQWVCCTSLVVWTTALRLLTFIIRTLCYVYVYNIVIIRQSALAPTECQGFGSQGAAWTVYWQCC